MGLWGGNKESTQTKTAVAEKPKEQTFESFFEGLGDEQNLAKVIRLVSKFNLKLLPSDFPYQKNLELKEGVIKDEDGLTYRTDYVIAPKKALTTLGDGRKGLDSKYIHRLDDVVQFLRIDRLKQDLFHNEARASEGHLIKRILTSDGWEAYLYKDTEIIEAQATFCTKCENCHEIIPQYDEANSFSGDVRYMHTSELREIRTFKFKPAALAVLFGTGFNIAEVRHPCQYISLQELIEDRRRRTADPPSLKIVFPTVDYAIGKKE
jgi:hypothetical protein